MGISPPNIRFHLELFNRGYYSNMKSALDMGAHDMYLNLDTFTEIMLSNNMSGFDPKGFYQLEGFPQRRIGARRFYNLIGFEKYECLDIAPDFGGIHSEDLASETANGMRWNALRINLNEPLKDSDLEGAFDLVCDYGNNEHVFRVTEAYRTMHRICRKGGIMMIMQQVHKTNGYYNFNPSYFEAMIKANDYRLIAAIYAVNNHLISVDSKIEQFLAPDHYFHVMYAMRKINDNDFIIPSRPLQRDEFAIPEITCMRMPDTSPRNYLTQAKQGDFDLFGGRDALRILATKLNPFRNSSRIKR